MKKQLLILTVAALLINSAGLAAPRVSADIIADEEYTQADITADSEENTEDSNEDDTEDSEDEDESEDNGEDADSEDDSDVESEDNEDSEEDENDTEDSEDDSEEDVDSESEDDFDEEAELEDAESDDNTEANGETNSTDDTEDDTNTSSSTNVMGTPTVGSPGKGNTTSVSSSTSSSISSIIASTAITNPFTDVSESDWFYGYVMNVYKNGIFTGTTDTTFAPYSSMTRAMLVTTLYRYAGSPAVSSETVFSDVAADSWYSAAVAWAADNGIVTGFTDNTFAPDASITREQLAVIMHRYAVLNGADTTLGDLSSYADSDSVSDWARDSFAWATANRIISGREGGILDPHGTATRAEAAAIFVRVDSLF